ncbi:hypothetical protein TWF970_001626 [Orbilia oligospora]|uniref:Uncharacterized protein n=1 Tax=Orbilia oligospora TaxID=2813651 RepID=A0A7C8R1R9_ORBOL|nr:hypothetical protein TWF970_001626 [Orbilia oligospora]
MPELKKMPAVNHLLHTCIFYWNAALGGDKSTLPVRGQIVYLQQVGLNIPKDGISWDSGKEWRYVICLTNKNSEIAGYCSTYDKKIADVLLEKDILFGRITNIGFEEKNFRRRAQGMVQIYSFDNEGPTRIRSYRDMDDPVVPETPQVLSSRNWKAHPNRQDRRIKRIPWSSDDDWEPLPDPKYTTPKTALRSSKKRAREEPETPQKKKRVVISLLSP